MKQNPSDSDTSFKIWHNFSKKFKYLVYRPLNQRPIKCENIADNLRVSMILLPT